MEFTRQENEKFVEAVGALITLHVVDNIVARVNPFLGARTPTPFKQDALRALLAIWDADNGLVERVRETIFTALYTDLSTWRKRDCLRFHHCFVEKGIPPHIVDTLMSIVENVAQYSINISVRPRLRTDGELVYVVTDLGVWFKIALRNIATAIGSQELLMISYTLYENEFIDYARDIVRAVLREALDAMRCEDKQQCEEIQQEASVEA